MSAALSAINQNSRKALGASYSGINDFLDATPETFNKKMLINPTQQKSLANFFTQMATRVPKESDGVSTAPSGILPASTSSKAEYAAM